MVFTRQLIALIAGLGIGLSITSPLVKRDAPTVLADIDTISIDFDVLNSVVRGFDGNISNAVPVTDTESTVQSDLVRAIGDTDSSAAFSDGESTDVTNALTGLRPTINRTLDSFVGKKPEFDTAGLTGTILGDLQSLRNLTSQFSSAVQQKVASTGAATISSGTTDTDAAYASAIAVYSP